MARKKTTEEFKQDIETLYPNKYTIIGDYDGRTKPVKIKYNKCGHVRDTIADKIYKGRNCPICCGGVLLTQKEFEEEVRKTNPHLIVTGEYKGVKEPVEVYCTLCDNKSYPLADNLKKQKMSGCSVCNGKIVKIGYNDIWTTAPEVAKLLLNPEDGYKVTKCSDKYMDFLCPTCKNILNRAIKTVYTNGLCCPCCSERISYPERFLINFLKQLNEDFKTQKTFKWSKNIEVDNKKICGTKIYDFYINNKNIIIETHGKQHYTENSFFTLSNRTLFDEQENDRLKEQLAKDNNINYYIILDCRESNLEWIKNSILNSKLNNLYDLSIINWDQCHEYAISSKIKEAADLYNNNFKRKEIAKIMHISKATVTKYLREATNLNMCNYISR